jgi:hypothetical protein
MRRREARDQKAERAEERDLTRQVNKLKVAELKVEGYGNQKVARAAEAEI